jgi:outer membrane protein assembly factor BamB
VLYALEGTTGREIWNSGATISSFARAGLSGGAGVVYVTTYDSTLYAFGVPIEK